MKRLGIVARADTGGLASQTYEARRHLKPSATWIVDMGPHGRGPLVPAFLEPAWAGEEVLVATDRPDPTAAREWLLDRSDVVFACETVYGHELTLMARDRGVDVVVQVNPELFRPTDYPAARYVLPTDWETERVGAPVLPVPIARDRLPYRRRTKCEVLYHPAAPAFHDRNGTGILAQALAAFDHPVLLYVRGEAPRSVRQLSRSKVKVEILPPHLGPYWEAWPEDADVMVLPRRYGGLSLPFQEAASLGMPVVTLDVAPQSSWPFTHRIATTGCRGEVMRGGVFPVHDADPRTLADALNFLARTPGRVARLSEQADEWAETLAWPHWIDRYRAALGLDSPRLDG